MINESAVVQTVLSADVYVSHPSARDQALVVYIILQLQCVYIRVLLFGIKLLMAKAKCVTVFFMLFNWVVSHILQYKWKEACHFQ